MPNQATAADVRSTISSSHKKLLLGKNFDDVIACNLWFGPQSKNLAMPMLDLCFRFRLLNAIKA